jgi:hypothetical protein
MLVNFRAYFIASVVSFSFCFESTCAGPIGTYYIVDNADQPGSIYAITGTTSARTQATFDFPNPGYQALAGPLAVYGNTVATTGRKGDFGAEQNGEIYTGAPGLTLTKVSGPTTNNTTSDLFFDGTSDGKYNFIFGFNSSAQGTIFRCNLDWSNPTAIALMPDAVSYAGITYDSRNGSFFVSAFHLGVTSIYNVSLPSSVGLATVNAFRTSFSNTLPLALAMDVDHTLWFTASGGVYPTGTLVHMDSSTFAIIETILPTDRVLAPWGGEIAPPITVPEPTTAAALLTAMSATLLTARLRLA